MNNIRLHIVYIALFPGLIHLWLIKEYIKIKNGGVKGPRNETVYYSHTVYALKVLLPVSTKWHHLSHK